MLPISVDILTKIVELLDKTAVALLRATCHYYKNNIMAVDAGDLTEYAIEYDSLELLKMSQPLIESFKAALIRGSLKCAEYLYNHGNDIVSPIEISTIRERSVEYYATIMLFRQLHDSYVRDGVAQTHILTRQILDINKCKWSVNTSNMLATCGPVDLLEYVINNNCPYNDNILSAACCNKSSECLEYLHGRGFILHDKLYNWAVKYDSIECVKYLHKHGCDFTVEQMARAAKKSAVESFCYMANIKPTAINYLVLKCAIRGNSILILNYIFTRITINDKNLIQAAQIGSAQTNIELDDYDKSILLVDAFVNSFNYRSNYNCADYLRELGWPWNKLNYISACLNSNTHCLDYLLDNNCPFDGHIGRSIRPRILKYSNRDIEAFLTRRFYKEDRNL